LLASNGSLSAHISATWRILLEDYWLAGFNLVIIRSSIRYMADITGGLLACWLKLVIIRSCIRYLADITSGLLACWLQIGHYPLMYPLLSGYYRRIIGLLASNWSLSAHVSAT